MIKFRGKFRIEHFRKGIKIGEYELPNGVVDVGLNKALDVMFHDDTKVTPWYIGLVDNSGWTAFDAGDTMGSHAGWTELVDYDEAARVEWTEGAAASKSITNATPVTFTMNATKSVKGMFLTSVNTKSGSTGTLWATAAFASTVSVEDDDELKVTYTITAAAA